MLDFVLNFLFPPVCGICGKLDKNWICPKCKIRLKRYEKFELLQTKEKINELFNFYTINTSNLLEEKFLKSNGLSKNIKANKYDYIYFDEFLYCFEYKNLIRNLILKYKFSDCGYISNIFGNVILNNKKINEILKKYDIMISVPMDKIKKAKRGYNQTELITKYIEKNINLKYGYDSKINIIKNIENRDYNNIIFNNKILTKNRITKTQSTLNAKKRIENIKNAFLVKDKKIIENKNIILFDDIATTGSTINEISKTLKNAGANKILVLVIAKD